MAASLDLPRRLGPYWLVQRLESGGLVTTFLAEPVDSSDGSRCAVQIVQPLLADNRRFHEHLLAETRALARVVHPHVVTVLDQGWAPDRTSTIGERAYAALELVDGVSLAQLQRRVAGAFEWPLVLAIVDALGAALTAAHALEPQVVHGDVAPSNVLVARDGTIKLGDFSAGPDAPHAEWGVNLAYASPEAVSGLARPESDVFSLGVIVWELVHGRRYYADLASGFGSGPLRPPSPDEIETYRPQPANASAIARAVSPVFEDALNVDPSARLASPTALRDALLARAASVDAPAEPIESVRARLGELVQRLWPRT